MVNIFKNKNFPLVNLKTSLNERGFNDKDTITGLIKEFKKIEDVLGEVILYSNGLLKKGYDYNLIQLEGEFNISKWENRFYWGNKENFFNSEPYFVKSGDVFIGYQRIDLVRYNLRDSISRFNIFKKPIFNIEGLYKNYGVKEKIGFLNSKENLNGKLNFLEDFLNLENKEFIKDPILRLKFLEENYLKNALLYAIK